MSYLSLLYLVRQWIEYTWILCEGKFVVILGCYHGHQFFGQFVYPIEEEGMGLTEWMEIIVILASCENPFNRVYENLVQHPSNNNTSIFLKRKSLIIFYLLIPEFMTELETGYFLVSLKLTNILFRERTMETN